MVINARTMDALLATMRKSFSDGMKQAVSSYERWAMDIPSNTKIERYPMTMLLSVMREWRGPRQIGNLVAKYLEVTNLDHEISWGIPTNDLRDDNIGYIQPVFAQGGQNTAAYWGKLAASALVANGNWLDGNAFFYATREIGKSSTIANYVTDAPVSTP